MHKKMTKILALSLMLTLLIALATPMAFADDAAECEHVWDEGTVTKAATCQETGEKVYTCTLCGETSAPEVIPKTDHTIEMAVIKAATVLTRGEANKRCSVCGLCLGKSASDSEIWVVASNRWVTKFFYYLPYTLNYQSLSGTVTQLPGNFRVTNISNDYYGSEGLTTHFPSIDNADEAPVGYEISQFGSNRYVVLENGVPGSSFTPGDPTDRTYSWMNDTDTSYTIVSVFVISEPEVAISQDGALLTAEIANSNENLTYAYQWYKDGQPIDGETGSTCVVAEKCADASAKYSVEVTAENAASSTIPTIGPGKSAKSAEFTPATVHAPVVDPAVAATCEETGLTEGSHCSECGAVLTAQEEVPALGHSYGSWADTKDGKTHTRVCANDASHVQSEEHSFGDWIVTKEATQTEAGSRYRQCSVCGYKETAEIPAGNTAPKTGDESNLAVYFVLSALSLMSAAGAAVILKKKA